MNKADLIVDLNEEIGLTKDKAREVVNRIFGKMTDALAIGDRVEIRGFCSVSVREHKGYTGRNPKTGESFHVKAKKLPFFKSGKELKEKIMEQTKTAPENTKQTKPAPMLTEQATEQITEQRQTVDRAVRAVADMEGKHLMFTLCNEEYGISISKIREIIGMMPVTAVPNTPEYMKGVINLRGKVIPVVALRARFGMEAIDYTERTCIIVVEIAGPDGTCQVGIIVDSVVEVLDIKAEHIENTPTFGIKLNTDYILGMANLGGGVKVLLDIDRVISEANDIKPEIISHKTITRQRYI